MSDPTALAAELRRHVQDRGGLSRDAETGEIVLPNGAWAMMLKAAATIEAVTKERDEARASADLIARHNAEIEAEHEATFDSLTAAEAERDRLREALGRTLTWAESRCPCHNEEPNPCPLCGASVENLEACKSAENTLPADILIALREAKPCAAKERGE